MGNTSVKKKEVTLVDNRPFKNKDVEGEIKANLFSEKNIEKVKINAVVDAVFLCDCTSSMTNFIGHAKATIKKMVEQIREKYTDSSIFVGFIGYRDHCDTNILESLDLTGDMEEVYKFIDKLSASGGGDQAEAVADALNAAAKSMSWREDSLKLLLHILDAPPHGKEFKAMSDDHRNGCPCGLSCQELVKKLDAMGTQYLILKYRNATDKMVEIFKTCHKNVRAITLDEPGFKGGCSDSLIRDMPISDCEMEESYEGVKEKNEDYEKEIEVKRIHGTASFCAAENMVEVAADNVMEILESNIKIDGKE